MSRPPRRPSGPDHGPVHLVVGPHHFGTTVEEIEPGRNSLDRAVSRWLAGAGRRGGDVEADAPLDGVAQEPLVHGVEQSLEGVAVGEVAESALAWLADPSGGGRLALIGAAPEQEMDTALLVGRRMLLIGDEEAKHTAGDGVIRVDDLDAESLQRPVADVPAPDEVEVGAIGGVQSHGVMEVEEPPTPLDERGHRTLLLGSHPGEMRAVVPP